MSGVSTINIHNPQFLKKAAGPYDCLMIVGKTYLSYALVDEAHTTVWSLYHAEQVGPVGKNDVDLILADRRVQKAMRFFLAIDTGKQATVPAALYEPDKKHLYIRHLFTLEPEEELLDMQPADDLVNLFAVKKDSLQFFRHRLRHLRFFSAAAVALRSYAAQTDPESRQSVFLAHTPDGFTLTAYHDKKLLLHQSYSGRSVDDRLYHLANLHHQLKLKPEESSIFLHGESDSIETLALLQGQYARADYIGRIPEIDLPKDAYLLNSGYFFTLYALLTCAS